VRVLHVAPSIARSYGGPTRSLAGYVAAALGEGADVTVVAPSASDADMAEFEMLVGPDRVRTFSSVGRHAFTISLPLVRWVASEAHAFDVVHVHGLFNPVSDLSCAAAIHSDRPVVLRPFGTLSRYTFTHRRRTLKKLWLAAVNGKNLRGAAALHFTTAEERDEAKWHGVTIGERAHVVPPPWLESPSREARSSDRNHSRPQVAFIGRVNPIKNLEALIDAWPLVLESLPAAELVIAGPRDDSYARMLMSRAASIGAHISFRGFLGGDAKAELLASAAAFVLPSHHENFGIAALEAVAAGVPVVLSPHVQLKSFVEEHRLGRVTDTAPQLLAKAVLDVLDDETLRARVRSEGSRLVSANFGIPAIGPRLSAMYLDAVEHQQRKSNSRRL